MEDWRKKAKCEGLDPNIFFPRGSMVEETPGEKAAKAICLGKDGAPPCPVRQDCQDYALEASEIYGVWGGMTEKERREVWRLDKRKRTMMQQRYAI